MFSTALLTTVLASAVSATLFPTFPVKGSTCAVGTTCQIKWEDSADAPPTSTWGETAIDLVKGDASSLKVAQAIGGVTDPSTATAYTFTPDPSLAVGTDYAIRFVAKTTNTTTFSGFFSISGGSGNATAGSSTLPATVGNGTAGANGTSTSRSAGASASASGSGNGTSGAAGLGFGSVMIGGFAAVAGLVAL